MIFDLVIPIVPHGWFGHPFLPIVPAHLVFQAVHIFLPADITDTPLRLGLAKKLLKGMGIPNFQKLESAVKTIIEKTGICRK